METAILEKATFFLDEGLEYPGVHNPTSLWNGFAVPYFSKDVSEKILNDLELEFHWNGDVLVFDYEGTQMNMSPKEFDGEPMYCIGGYEWTWTVEGD